MALDISYDDASGLLRIVGSGVVTMEDRRKCFGHIFSAPEYAAARHVLINASEITNAPMDGDMPGMVNIVKSVRSRFPGRMAIVNSRAGHVTVSNIIAISSDPVDLSVKVFFTEGDALVWILG